MHFQPQFCLQHLFYRHEELLMQQMRLFYL
nr:MAG TPA: hypothetical protein [Caudoviricetes sp.]